jgi:hypothetical protein
MFATPIVGGVVRQLVPTLTYSHKFVLTCRKIRAEKFYVWNKSTSGASKLRESMPGKISLRRKIKSCGPPEGIFIAATR